LCRGIFTREARYARFVVYHWRRLAARRCGRRELPNAGLAAPATGSLGVGLVRAPRRRLMWCGTTIALTGMSSYRGYAPWASGTDLFRPDRHGKIPTSSV